MDTQLSDIEEITQTDGKSAWLLCYADLVTLILVFFILLFALSNNRLEKMKDSLKSLQIAIGTETPKTSLYDIINTESLEDRKMLDQLTGMREVNIMREIASLIRSKNLEENAKAIITEGKIVLKIDGKALFDTGSADLLPEATRVLSGIVQIINENPQYHIDIQGHTDNRPIKNAKFASNWELSAIRATNVLRYLVENGTSPMRLTATGFGDSRPAESNQTPEGRMKNRRVEIVLKEK